VVGRGIGHGGGVAAADTPLERGKYLVEGILTCGNCHTPRVQGGALDTARLHAGGPQTWETSEYKVKGANITPDRETGIGGWSANEVLRAIRDGVRPNGQQLSPQMPYGYYRIFTPSDLEAVVAYVRSLPAVSSTVPHRCTRSRRCTWIFRRARTSRCRRAP